MPRAYEEFVKQQMQSDNNVILFAALVLVCLLVVGWCWRLPRFASIVRKVAPVLFPALTAPLNPVVSGMALVSAFFPVDRLVKRLPHGVLLVLVLLVAAGLRLPRMNENLWYDEAYSATVAEMSIEQFIDVLPHDVHPPLYYLVLMAWERVGGSSPLALRVPTLAFSLLSIFLLYRLAIRVTGEDKVGLAAAAVAAVMPASVYYGVELRSYSLLSSLILGAAVCLLERRPRLFAVCLVGMMLTHNFGWLYAAVLAASALLYQSHFVHRGKWLISAAAGLGAGGLWLPGLIEQSKVVSDGYWLYFAPGKLLTPLYTMTLQPTQDYVGLIVPVLGLIFVTVYLSRSWVLSRAGLVWGALVVGVPLLVALVSVVWRPIWVDRSLYPSVMLLAIPMGWTLVKSSEAVTLRRVGVGLAVTGLALGYIHPRTDYRQYLSQFCPDASAMFNTNLMSAFVSSFSSGLPQFSWIGADDIGETFQPEDKALFGFDVADITALRGQTVCVMQMDSPATKPDEYQYLDQLKDLYPYVEHVVKPARSYPLRFFEFEVR